MSSRHFADGSGMYPVAGDQPNEVTMHTDHEVYRFRFGPDVPMADVHESLKLAIFAAEGMHGAAQVRLGFGYCCDDATRCHVLDARAEAGGTVVRIFTGFLTQQFGEEAFHVEPCSTAQAKEGAQ